MSGVGWVADCSTNEAGRLSAAFVTPGYTITQKKPVKWAGLNRKMNKPRPLCLVCGKPISAANCGFPKKPRAEIKLTEEADRILALEQRLREKGWIL